MAVNIVKTAGDYVFRTILNSDKKYDKFEVFSMKNKSKRIENVGIFDDLNIFPSNDCFKDFLLVAVTCSEGKIMIYKIFGQVSVMRVFCFRDEIFPVTRFLWYPESRYYLIFILVVIFFFFFFF
jgi:hypothetical protein